MKYFAFLFCCRAWGSNPYYYLPDYGIISPKTYSKSAIGHGFIELKTKKICGLYMSRKFFEILSFYVINEITNNINNLKNKNKNCFIHKLSLGKCCGNMPIV